GGQGLCALTEPQAWERRFRSGWPIAQPSLPARRPGLATRSYAQSGRAEASTLLPAQGDCRHEPGATGTIPAETGLDSSDDRELNLQRLVRARLVWSLNQWAMGQ